jgi:acyl-[acyl-carrier-protein]-phospholipid O-acyltransferase/long-chain-fatty-acid--[acyl-carrier-protein] ligase
MPPRVAMSSTSIQVLHKERLPSAGTVIVPGRLAFSQLHVLEKLLSGRKITWLVEAGATPLLEPQVRAHLEKSGSGAMFDAGDNALPAAGRQLRPLLENGGVLVFVPAPVSARTGVSCQIPAHHLRALCQLGLPVTPLAVDLPRESCLSTEHPSSLPVAVLAFGHSLDAGQATPAGYRESLFEAAEAAWASRSLLNASLGEHLLIGLKKHSKNRVLDGADDSELTYDKVLGVAIALSKHIAAATAEPRVGIVLPPGKAGLIANLAVIFAGKVPVNLNFTAGHDAVKSAMRQSGVDRYITADAFVRKISTFPWPANRDLIFIERVLPTLKKQIKQWVVLSKLLPSSVLSKMLGVGKRRGNDEAILLFTSGSSGEPKGVVLSHRNVLANVCQFASRLQLEEGSRILGCLPLFHSFGCTVTLWFPCIEGLDLVTYPSPLETKRLAELVAHHQVRLLLSTPTFLRGYMKRVEPAQLSSLQLVVTGAEKLPQNLADAFEERFGIRPQEGYGLTETSPATNVNLPDLGGESSRATIPSTRPGSVGHPLPGLAIKLTDPVTDEHVPLDRQGIIWFKGANIFPGYLDQPKKTAEVLINGWFRTGDVGRIDDDGFLYIEGRISRFSKIAGEMVPHETVEAAINKVLGLDQETERRVAVVGVPDDQKGEVIVLLSTIAGQALEQECIDLRYKLLDEGLPSLWTPKQIIPVAEIPVLASGKLDIKACEELVKK